MNISEIDDEKVEAFFGHLFDHNLGYAADLELSMDDIERILQITNDAMSIVNLGIQKL